MVQEEDREKTFSQGKSPNDLGGGSSAMARGRESSLLEFGRHHLKEGVRRGPYFYEDGGSRGVIPILEKSATI